MANKILLIIFLLLCEPILYCARSNQQNNPFRLTPVFVEFQNEDNYNLFIIESVNLPGRITPGFNDSPRNLFFDFNGRLTKDEIDELFVEHITALCEYSIFTED